MSVFRVHKTDNYTVMSNYHLRDKRLSLKSKGLLSIMLSLPSDWDYSIQGLTTLSSDGETAVRSGLQELEENGYLKRTPVRERGIIRDWQYDIYEIPSEPVVENPTVDNMAQINTKEINTKENSNFTNVKLEQATPTPKPLIDTDTANGTATVSSKKKNLYEKCADYIDEYTQDSKLREILVDYLKFRLAVKDKPVYFPQWKSIVNKLDDLAGDIDTKYKIVQQSLNKGWLIFVELKANNYKTGQDQNVFSEYGKVKTGNSGKGVLTNVQF